LSPGTIPRAVFTEGSTMRHVIFAVGFSAVGRTFWHAALRDHRRRVGPEGGYIDLIAGSALFGIGAVIAAYIVTGRLAKRPKVL
jgi:hypothetical protein